VSISLKLAANAVTDERTHFKTACASSGLPPRRGRGHEQRRRPSATARSAPPAALLCTRPALPTSSTRLSVSERLDYIQAQVGRLRGSATGSEESSSRCAHRCNCECMRSSALKNLRANATQFPHRLDDQASQSRRCALPNIRMYARNVRRPAPSWHFAGPR